VDAKQVGGFLNRIREPFGGRGRVWRWLLVLFWDGFHTVSLVAVFVRRKINLAPINFRKELRRWNAERVGQIPDLDQINAQRAAFEFGNGVTARLMPARKLQLNGEIRLRQSELITQSAHKSPDENETPLFHWLKFSMFAVVSCLKFRTKSLCRSFSHALPLSLFVYRAKLFLHPFSHVAQFLLCAFRTRFCRRFIKIPAGGL
jgi:hypothetical protein